MLPPAVGKCVGFFVTFLEVGALVTVGPLVANSVGPLVGPLVLIINISSVGDADLNSSVGCKVGHPGNGVGASVGSAVGISVGYGEGDHIVGI